MVNEEDHVRIQVLHEGLALSEAAEMADRIDTLLNESLRFAFDSRARLPHPVPDEPRYRHAGLCDAAPAGTHRKRRNVQDLHESLEARS